MNYRGVPNWPPVWTLARNGSVKTVKGEVGVLKYVHASTDMSNKCYLVISYQSERYTGCILCRDHSFCAQIAHLLRDHVGRSIKDIGDLDLSYTL